MVLSIEQIKQYCDLVPIGYYAGFGIPMHVEECQASYANIVDKSIVISSKQVNDKIKSMSTITDEIARPLIYHEVAHVLISPNLNYYGDYYDVIKAVRQHYDSIDNIDSSDFNDLVENITARWECNRFNRLNIVEDERIETVFDSSFSHCDFKENVHQICGDPKDVDDFMGIFFNCVRYGYIDSKIDDKAKIENERNRLIDELLPIRADASIEELVRYEANVDILYIDIIIEIAKKMCKQKNVSLKAALNALYRPQSTIDIQKVVDALEDALSRIINASKNGGLSSLGKISGDVSAKAFGQGTCSQRKLEDAINDSLGDLDYDGYGESEESDESDEASDDSCNDNVKTHSTGIGTNSIRELVKKKFDKCDVKIRDMMISKFKLRSLNDSTLNAMHAYSGKFDVKAVGRDDWRIFKKTVNGKGDGSKLGKKFHLVLILDQSGSYDGNDNATNMILASLTEAEKLINGFTFDVIKFGNSSRLCKKHDRYSRSTEGTTYDIDLVQLIEKCYDSTASNYYIFLNDGDGNEEQYGVRKLLFKTLNKHRATLILSADVEVNVKTPNCKMVRTYSYTSELSKNVYNALLNALAYC